MLDSHYLSYLLRHHPEDKGLTLDEFGWCRVDDLLKALNITKGELQYVVANNTRYIFSADGQFIKAAHGHSVPIKYTNQQTPPKYLYHGTATRFLDSIMKSGLQKMTREAVHLSDDYDSAFKIGLRHAGGNEAGVVNIRVKAKEMEQDGFVFYKSEDGVWLVDSVPSKYLEVNY